MYLSTIKLNPHHFQARRDIGDAYEMHRTLTSVFGRREDTEARSFLWRLEHSGELENPGVVIVQSATPANWSVLDEYPGYTQEIRANRRIDLDRLIEAGRCYRFRLQVNPTVTRNGKRIGLRDKEEQVEWLLNQGQKHGFEVLAFLRKSSQRLQLRQGNSGNRITLHSVLFEGILQAKNPPLLQKAVLNGLGHGRAWGLGLLTIEPVSLAS